MVRKTSTTTTTTTNNKSSAAAAVATAVSAVVEIVYQKPKEFANIHEYDDNIVDIDLFPTAEGYRSMDTMIDNPADSRYEVLPKEVEEDSRNDEHNNSTNQSSYSSKIDDMKDIRETTATNSTVQSSESYQSESDVKEKSSTNDKTTVLSAVVVKSTGDDTVLSRTESQLSNAIAEDTTKKLQDEMKKKNDDDDNNSTNYSIIPSISTTCSNNKTEKDLQNEDDDSKISDCNKSVDDGDDDNDDNGTAIVYESTPDDDDRTCASLSSNNRSFISSSNLLPSTSKLDNAAPEEAVSVKEGINVGKHVDILASWLMTGFIGCADAGLKEPTEFLDWDGVTAKKYNTTIINNDSIQQQQPKKKDHVPDEYQIESKEEDTTETTTYGTNNDDLSKIKKDCSIDSGISTTSTHDELSVLVRGIHNSNNIAKKSSPPLPPEPPPSSSSKVPSRSLEPEPEVVDCDDDRNTKSGMVKRKPLLLPRLELEVADCDMMIMMSHMGIVDIDREKVDSTVTTCSRDKANTTCIDLEVAVKKNSEPSTSTKGRIGSIRNVKVTDKEASIYPLTVEV